jgi:hypothetical protein
MKIKVLYDFLWTLHPETEINEILDGLKANLNDYSGEEFLEKKDFNKSIDTTKDILEKMVKKNSGLVAPLKNSSK